YLSIIKHPHACNVAMLTIKFHLALTQTISLPLFPARRFFEKVCKRIVIGGQVFNHQKPSLYFLLIPLMTTRATVGIMSRSLAWSVVKVTRTKCAPFGSST